MRTNYCKNLFRDEERTERKKGGDGSNKRWRGRVQAIIVGVKECVIVDLEEKKQYGEGK